MADAYEQGESSSGLRDTIEKYIGKAKRLVANDEVSQSERETFESEKKEFERQKEKFESEKKEFEFNKVVYKAKYAIYMVEKATLKIYEELQKRETREGVVGARDVLLNNMGKKFRDFTLNFMYHKTHLSEEEIQATMRDIEKIIASCSVLSESTQLYSKLDERKCLSLELMETPDDEEFA